MMSVTLNAEQKKAVNFGAGPLLIIAGAGSGKTTVVTQRIVHLISSGLAKPTEILALTFTEKASREMENRIDVALPYGVTNMWISTFHAFCDRILRAEVVNIGIDPGYTLMTEAETIMFFRKHLFDFTLTYFRPLGNPQKFISGMIQHFSRLKDEDITPEQYQKFAKKLKTEDADKYIELAGAYKKYEELKIKEGKADYADLIQWTLRLLRTRPAILKRYQDQFKYVLIDEFQDTNFAQNELAILLAGKRKNITVVGDDDQAIYRFRGAAISNIIQFRKTFPKARVVVLSKNYRSTKEILDRSYTLIQHNNPDRLEVAEKIDKKLESERRVNGEAIRVLYADRVENEAEMVANEIKNLQEKIKNWSDVAILVRANAHAEPFVRALSRAGVPVQFLGPGQLFRQPEIKNLIAYLKVLYSFEDNVSMYRVLSMDIFDISPRDIAAISNAAKKYGTSIFEVCEKSDVKYTDKNSSGKISFVVNLIHKHLGIIKKESAGQILYYFLEESGILKELATSKTALQEKAAENIAKFFGKLKTYEIEHEDANVFTVVDWIDLSMSLGESPLAADMDWSANNAVNIMTVHSAKGLEFPVVFMVNLVSARFPSSERKEQIPLPEGLVKEILPVGDVHAQEERRLFYVGMTRARDYLYFTGAQFYGEGKREKKLSPFIGEALGEEYVSGILITKSGKAGSGSARQLPLLEDWKPTAKISESQKPVRQKVSYLSYSQLSTFMTCPLQYKYRYIVKIPVPPSAALTFGDSIHRTMYAFYDAVRKGEKPGKNDLIKFFEDNWIRIGYRDASYEAKMKQHGVELLEEFYLKGYDPKSVPTSLEEAFKIQITPTLTLGGKIDRVDTLEDGTQEIIDYKTGQAPKAKDPKKDLQLSVYAMASQAAKVIVSFYFFEGQQKISATRTVSELEATRLEIAQKADEISRSEFEARPGKHCDFCEFRLICEAWS